ncbi:hypothetical protein HDV01_003129 [Terramyces sp. JEL0728]|nr:hypothetical protein HDV01_003129 [Terramyces sp. JEL0728]
MQEEEVEDVLDAYLSQDSPTEQKYSNPQLNTVHEMMKKDRNTSHSAEDISQATKFGFLKSMTKKGNEMRKFAMERTKEWSEKKSQTQYKKGISPLYNGPSIFGMSLADATARSNEILGANDSVPRIVKTCISYIEAKGVNELGIYRLSGSTIEVNELRNIFNQYQDADLYQILPDSASVTSMFKAYVRECIFNLKIVPEVVLTDELEPQFAALVQPLNEQECSFPDTLKATDPHPIAQNKALLDNLAALISRLPIINRDFLALFLKHLNKIAANCAVNKMGLNNLQVVWSPTIRFGGALLMVFIVQCDLLFPIIDRQAVPARKEPVYIPTRRSSNKDTTAPLIRSEPDLHEIDEEFSDTVKKPAGNSKALADFFNESRIDRPKNASPRLPIPIRIQTEPIAGGGPQQARPPHSEAERELPKIPTRSPNNIGSPENIKYNTEKLFSSPDKAIGSPEKLVSDKMLDGKITETPTASPLPKPILKNIKPRDDEDEKPKIAATKALSDFFNESRIERVAKPATTPTETKIDKKWDKIKANTTPAASASSTPIPERNPNNIRKQVLNPREEFDDEGKPKMASTKGLSDFFNESRIQRPPKSEPGTPIPTRTASKPLPEVPPTLPPPSIKTSPFPDFEVIDVIKD